MTISYQIEKWDSVHPEIIKLGQEQYEEQFPVHQGKMKMRLNKGAYKALSDAYSLQIVTARDNGNLIGYCAVVIGPHNHYADTLCGIEDTYFLSKPYRKGMIGVRLFKETLKHLRLRGVEMVYFRTPVTQDVGPIFEFLGMKKTDEVYTMRLED